MLSTQITFRKATLHDLDAVTELLLKLWPDHSASELARENEAHLMDDTQALLLAVCDKAPVGIAHVSIRREYVEGSHNDICGYLEAIYVEPEYRLQGIARELVRECEKWSIEGGCTLFASDCELHNMDSYRFHLGIGFEEVSRNIHFAKRFHETS